MAKRIARGTPKPSAPATRNAPAERPLLVGGTEAAAEQGAGSSDGGYDSGNESPYDSEVGLSDDESGSEGEGSSDGEEEPDSESGGSDDDASGPPSDSSDDEFDAAAVDLLEASEPGQGGAAEPAGAVPGDDERCARDTHNARWPHPSRRIAAYVRLARRTCCFHYLIRVVIEQGG